MNGLGLAFLVVAAVLAFTLPRKYATLPLLASAAYMTSGQFVDVMGASFTIPRVLVAVTMVRILVRGERLAGGWRMLDTAVVVWAAVLLATSAFHTSDAWLYRSGIVWSELGSYMVFRVCLQDTEDVVSGLKATTVLMVPLALLMLFEKSSGLNPFGALGGVSWIAPSRDGVIRATGPFAHPILAGSVGAACIGASAALWWRSRKAAVVAAGVGLSIVYACTSSGPIMMVLFFIAAMALWPLRRHMALVRVGIVVSILTLAAVMKDPVYFLMARVDITGGSQGYYRSQLIRSSLEHFSEWWAAGTDYTRHWMATGIHANERHADITNHFLAMGVMGGIVLVGLLVLIFYIGFRDAGRGVHASSPSANQAALCWTLGALLFAYLINFFSISLFDQSIMFFYLLLAAIQAATTVSSFAGAAQPSAAGLQPATTRAAW